MTTYKVIKNLADVEYIERTTEDNVISWIPIDEANPDYQAYLNPEAEQSTPNLAP
jgi:hypothetical protein